MPGSSDAAGARAPRPIPSACRVASISTDTRTDPGAFARATNWKSYAAALLGEHVRGDVLEVKGGLGSVREAFASHATRQWHEANVAAEVTGGARYDTVLYVDVLEHLADDRAEIEAACKLLKPGGCIVIVAPAFPSAASAFDQTVGHRRRYTARSLAALMPPALRRRRLFFADSLGLLLNYGNRLLLRHAAPRDSHVMFWDRYVVPLSRLVDPVFHRFFGRSVMAVFERV